MIGATIDVPRRSGRDRPAQQAGEVHGTALPLFAPAAHHPGLAIGDQLEGDVGLGLLPADRSPGLNEPGAAIVEEELVAVQGELPKLDV
jgi:hypothetical protein